jgi:pimeloyl-ACP methyl ester carboxylesterase
MVPAGCRHGVAFFGMKEPLVLIHGFTGTPMTWEPVLSPLSEHFDVHAVTLAGHCGGPALGEGIECTPAALADDLERQMDDLGLETAHIGGNSLGGWLALELAVRGRARSVVALAPAGGWEQGSREERRLGRFFRRQRRMIEMSAPYTERLLRRPGLRKLAMRDVCVHGDRWTPAQAVAMSRGALDCSIYEAFIDIIERDGPPKAFEGIEVPVRIAWGTKDRILPAERHLPGYRRLLPDAEYTTLEGAGHIPMIDDPEGVVRSIREVTTRAPQPV